MKKQNPWLSIFPWNVKPVGKPTVIRIITKIKNIYNFLFFFVKTNTAIKIRADVSIGMACSAYSF
jgi:hypothetical protein